MAEDRRLDRRLVDLYFGQPGLLSYISADEPDRPGILHSSRITSNAPRFNTVGSTAELYAPSRPVFPATSSNSRQTLKAQGRWLSNHHPEAFIGGASTFSGMLKDTVNRAGHSENFQDERNSLVMGEMTDMRTPARPTVVPLFAAATGESGQKLRLAMADKSKWQWGEYQDALLHLSVVDTTLQENETIWIGDGLPIVNIKCVTSWWQSGRVRWLLVQTKSSVTLLQPEFRPVPVPDRARPSSDAFQLPSYVAPNPLVTLHHEETGGNEISDVWFMPASVGSLPRLGVIDRCGYWSVWTLLGTWQVSMNTLRLSLYKCGHISEGVLPSLPSVPAYPTQRHGMLQIGQTRLYDSVDLSVVSQQDTKKSDVSSHHLLIWNAQQVVVLDLEREMLFPKLDVVRQSRQAPDWIIGVEPSPANDNRVFVLTAQQVIWLDLSFNPGDAEPILRPTLLLACSHVGFGNEDYRMSTCLASQHDFSSTMVFIHSPKVSQLTVYWFGFKAETQLPQYHRHITSLPFGGNESAISKAQLIKVCPAELEASGASDDPGPGPEYMRNDVRFYQVAILDEDLSVRYGICTTSADPAIKVTLPTVRVSWSASGERKRFKKRRKRFLKHLGDTFVIPDGMTDESLETLLRRKRAKTNNDEMLEEDVALYKPRPKLLNVDRICQEIASGLSSAIDQGACGLPTEMIAIVRSAIEHGKLDKGSIPLTSWMQLFSNIQGPIPYSELSDGMGTEIRNLLESTGDNIVVTQLRRHAIDELPGSLLEYPSLLKQFSEFWLKSSTESFPPEMHRIRTVWVCEVARDFFLSSYGFVAQNVPRLQTGTSNDAENKDHDGIARQSSQRRKPDPKIATTSAAGLVPSNDAGDAAFQRLRLLAPTLEPGTLGSLKPPKVLSHWPSKRGVDINDYVSSVAVAEEAKVSHIKERRRKVELKMKAQAEMYKMPAFRRQGFPALDSVHEGLVMETRRQSPRQIMSSQPRVPDSSQSLAVAGPSVTMSQPVSGAFGDRKRVKKGKKKSGFR